MWTENKGLILRDGIAVDLKRLAEYLNIIEDERAARKKLANETKEKMDLEAKKFIAEYKTIAMKTEKNRTKTKDLLDMIEEDLNKISGVINR